jgi:hypothetical protein
LTASAVFFLAFRQSPSSIRRRCASTHAGGRCTRYHACTSAEVAQQGREPEEPFLHPCCRSLPVCVLKSPIGVCIGDDRQRRACHVRLAARSSRVSQCVLPGCCHMACLCSLPACYLVALYSIIAMASASIQHCTFSNAACITLRLTLLFWKLL